MDSQSVKNTDSAENKGYDSGKKVSGIKRHIGECIAHIAAVKAVDGKFHYRQIVDAFYRSPRP